MFTILMPKDPWSNQQLLYINFRKHKHGHDTQKRRGNGHGDMEIPSRVGHRELNIYNKCLSMRMFDV